MERRQRASLFANRKQVSFLPAKKMKILHCADVHLGSVLEASLSQARAKERRNELMLTFSEMIRYAEREKVQAVIIAGDLFDTSDVPPRTMDHAFRLMGMAQDITFFYLRGNHDTAPLGDLPENVIVAPHGGDWVYYSMENVTIAMCDPQENDNSYPYRLKFEKDRVNIAVLHGQTVQSANAEKDRIPVRALRGQYIDYLALGHLHSYKTEQLDDRGIYCYSGCLEGRGFDECGTKGFVLLETKQGKIENEFIPFAKRTLHEIRCDISECTDMAQIEHAVLNNIARISREDMVAVHLDGALDLGVDKNLAYLEQLLKGRFYAARLYDDTRLRMDPADYIQDFSLKGTFIREVMKSDLTEAEKQKIITCGLDVLSGGEGAL